MQKRTYSKKDQKWQEHYDCLLKFVEREGHCRVPARHEEDGFRLGRWVLRQRQAKDELPPDRLKALGNLDGWYWSGQEAKWDRACDLLNQFIEREGHARVPKLHIEGDFKLGVWVMHQREKYRRGALSRERQKYLNKIPGWDWYGKPNKLPDADLGEVAEAIWGILFGRGPILESSAFHQCVTGLYDAGLIRSNHAHRNSPLATFVKKGIREAITQGYLDRPRRKYIRAVLAKANDYTVDDWHLCLANGLDREPLGKEDAILAAATWAEQNLGLDPKTLKNGSEAWKKVEKAIGVAVKANDLVRVGRAQVAAA
ncbi:MAG: helicase associated domain-containing protein [Myxococcota bacterium]|nr:helicase associated domain-containing protein [Myxococcota bacterium]